MSNLQIGRFVCVHITMYAHSFLISSVTNGFLNEMAVLEFSLNTLIVNINSFPLSILEIRFPGK